MRGKVGKVLGFLALRCGSLISSSTTRSSGLTNYPKTVFVVTSKIEALWGVIGLSVTCDVHRHSLSPIEAPPSLVVFFELLPKRKL